MTECTCDSVNISKKPLYIPHRLRTLLSTVKTINTISTLEEVLWAMKDYISERLLFDLTDPKIIHVDKDELGSVLGVHSFSLPELKRILLRLILKENVEAVRDLQKTLQATNSKRKSDETDLVEIGSKKLCLENLSLLPPSVIAEMKLNPQLLNKIYIHTSDSEESMEDAVFVKNVSSDDDDEEVGHFFEKEKILAVKRMYSLEYEVDTDSSSDNVSDASVTDTDSDAEEILQATFVTTVKTSDEEWWADESSEECSDLEISESDCWLCSECGIMNKPPMRYCLKCWEERKGWVAPQREHSDKRVPFRHRRKGNKTSEPADNPESNANIANDMVGVQPGTSDAFLSPLSSSPNTTISSHNACNSSPNTHVKDEKVCILCCSKPMNATVIHGKIGHQFSCYKCARKLQSLNKPCPICRRPIDRVVHQIMF